MNNPVEKNDPVGYVTADIIHKLETGVSANHSDISRSRGRDFQVALYSASTVEALKAENAALLSRVEMLTKALEPFNEACENLDENHGDGIPIWESPAAMGIDAKHLRNARAALQEKSHD